MARSAQIERLQGQFAKISADVQAAIEPALEKCGQELVTEMKIEAEPSRDTGALINSITMTPAGQATPLYSQPGGSRVVPEGSVFVTAGNTDVRYAHFVEYGTSKMDAEPFFWPSYRALKAKMAAQIKDALRKAVLK